LSGDWRGLAKLRQFEKRKPRKRNCKSSPHALATIYPATSRCPRCPVFIASPPIGPNLGNMTKGNQKPEGTGKSSFAVNTLTEARATNHTSSGFAGRDRQGKSARKTILVKQDAG